jgi:hypothetical protein
MEAFQFSGRLVRADPKLIEQSLDFAILVAMGTERRDDEFFVLPTIKLLETIRAYKETYLATARRDGAARKDVGHWTLHLTALTSGEHRENYDLRHRWAKYRDNWSLLEQVT